MYSQTNTRFEDRRPYPARHRAPEPERVPVTLPPWAAEPSRLIPLVGEKTVNLTGVGEGPTRKIRYPRSYTLPPVVPTAQAASPEPAPLPKLDLLGRCLHALRIRWAR